MEALATPHEKTILNTRHRARNISDHGIVCHFAKERQSKTYHIENIRDDIVNMFGKDREDVLDLLAATISRTSHAEAEAADYAEAILDALLDAAAPMPPKDVEAA